ncbi:purine-binding chemotaxis protein CheW [Fulvivirga sp. 29W222]|uniref:Purine-binding chemotaxis protein CheW n=1 Tax=Fulvivirga marina TaxID=2494733 RepID=A0A937FY31_9BACT|nr:chemotaxis protein CheW [Fulvivirga marina]MBL6447112.1 purine-binding chemotaxis protein CheW [Fulvivirga marina]
MQDKKESKLKQEMEHTGESLQLIVFKLGEEDYGIHISQIKEVVLTPNITKMPQTPPYVKGVANIRGNIIGIMDLEEKFGIRPGITTDEVNQRSNYTLVIESDTFKMGALVTEVPNTLTIDASAIEEEVDLVHDKNVDTGYIKGIVKLEGQLVILIDIFRVLTEDEAEKIELAQNETS